MDPALTLGAPPAAAAASNAAPLSSNAAMASAASAAGPSAMPAAAASAHSSGAPSSVVVPAALTAGARLEEHLVSALHQLWKSALIVEQGVAQPASASAAALDPTLERLMGMAQPRMSHADITNQNLQRQIDGFLQNLLSIDRVGRELQLNVPKSVIDCVESGDNPSALTARFIDDVRFQNDSVRAQIFATKLLHDQLQMRMELWDEVLTTQAQAGNESAKQLLIDAPTTDKQQVKT